MMSYWTDFVQEQKYLKNLWQGKFLIFVVLRNVG